MALTRRTLLLGLVGTSAATLYLGSPVEAATPWNKDIGFLRGQDAVIGGYDPVAYFTAKKPVKGNKKHASSYDGGRFFFASAENKAKFDENPAKYAPQFGGYCAWAVSQGYSAKIDPGAWTVHKGKLYLNYSDHVRSQWLGDVNGNIAKGNKNWPRVKASL